MYISRSRHHRIITCRSCATSGATQYVDTVVIIMGLFSNIWIWYHEKAADGASRHCLALGPFCRSCLVLLAMMIRHTIMYLFLSKGRRFLCILTDLFSPPLHFDVR
ncbi:hypothetical protein F5148DRAFT_890459 [Russula earlei]|uniref:Uncharacterized protein n=1 Tax=Russula earlei TaxID=71964 RepID=A0ACC0UAL4_9AGAM|nr:hypothetical protein F5148DRAFT_890459 [Russula earlei]